MVLAVKVGRPRQPWHGFWLALATFNIYSYYWDHKAHRELYHQFELAREGRGDGAHWYFLSCVLPVLRYPYHFTAVSNLGYVRHRMGLKPGISPGTFLGFVITALSVFLVGFFVGSILVSAGIRSTPAGALRVASGALVGLGFLFIAIGIGTYIVLSALAYLRLQRDINEVWTLYDWRAQQLTQVAAPSPMPTQAVAPSQPPVTRIPLQPASLPGPGTARPLPPGTVPGSPRAFTPRDPAQGPPAGSRSAPAPKRPATDGSAAPAQDPRSSS